MKLIRAEFENFRLLRHLALDFSTDPTKKLTVIRAAICGSLANNDRPKPHGLYTMSSSSSHSGGAGLASRH